MTPQDQDHILPEAMLRNTALRLISTSLFTLLVASFYIACSDDASPCDGCADTSDAAVDVHNTPDSSLDLSSPDSNADLPSTVRRSFAPNDISILFPLGRGELWRADVAAMSAAHFGEINAIRFPGLGQNVGASPGVFPFVNDSDAEYSSLRIVALRIEPCNSGCAAQIRFVLQSVDSIRFRDGAVHVSHNLDTAQFGAFRFRLAELQAMSPENSDIVLQVNPTLTAQGMSGPYALALREHLRASLSASTLYRITFMTRTEARLGQWEFGGLNFADGIVSGTTEIFGFSTGAKLQVITAPLTVGYEIRLDSSSAIVTHSDSAFASALRTVELATKPLPEQRTAFDALVRRHNPRMVTPDTADCASCHIASTVRSRTFFGLFSSTTAYALESAAQRVSGGADDTVDNFRAFGYFDDTPVISQRVANDTHLSLVKWPL
jgi:hypothetical protein